MDKTTKRTLVLTGLFLTALLVVTIIIYSIVTSDTHSSGPAQSTIGEQVSQSIADPLNPDKVPVEGKDFRLEDKEFYENGTWMIATVVDLGKNPTDPATIVMKQENGAFVTALGPGTAFPAEATTGLPQSVFERLRKKELIVEQTQPELGD